MISVACPLLGVEEEDAVLSVLRSGQLAQGERVTLFERKFAELCQVRYAIAVSSGTAALHLALLAHGIGVGDEVITTPFSFAATANAILLVGATPVFVDIDPATFNLDVGLVETAITPRTKAIVPVHLYGNPCEIPRLAEISIAHNLALIEDACQAHAASINSKPVGSFGTGCFSFYPTKNMTTGEGGMVTTNDPMIAERVRLLRNQGQKERYCHTSPGFNYRMTDLQAAIGLVQLTKLEQFTEVRRTNAAFLTSHLKEIVQTPSVREGYRHVFHQYTIRVPPFYSRDEWTLKLCEKGIHTGIYYPCPIYQQPYYQSSPERWRIGTYNTRKRNEPVVLPEAEKAAQQVLSLPVHPALSGEDLLAIVREIHTLCR